MADSGFKFSRLGGGDGAIEGDHTGGHEALGDDIEKALREGDGKAQREPGMPSLLTTGGGGGHRSGYEKGARGTGKTAARWSLILMLLLGIVCFLSLVLSIIAINRVRELTPAAEKIWTFAIGTDNLNLHYINPKTGEMDGFDVDMVQAVCSFAGKECRIVTDDYANCWRSSDTGDSGRGGIGLLNGWYDGCVGWSQTLERRRTFAFTKPYTKPLKSAFFVRSNAEVKVADINMTGKRIGFIDGYADDQYCVNAHQDALTGLPLQPAQVFHFPTPEAASSALKNQSVDAIFTTEYVNLTKADMLPGQKFNCSTRGRSVMTRMDSHLEDWWNAAYSHVWRSTYYHLLCQTVEMRHGKFDALPKEEICLHL